MSARTRVSVISIVAAVTTLLTLGVWSAIGLSAQQRPVRDTGAAAKVGQGTIAGTIVDDGKQPVRRAVVNLSGTELGAARATMTDDRGRFLFDALPAGRYALAVDKPGWVRTYYGAKQPGRGPGTTIALDDGQALTDLAITQLRGAVLTGRLVDERGEPLAGVRPMALESRTVGGQRMLSMVLSGTGISAQTDDRGEFRLYGLPPGSYVVAASTSGVSATGLRAVTEDEIRWARQPPPPGRPPQPAPPSGGVISYAPVYFPGTTDASQATPVTLAAGEERSGIDFAVRPIAVAQVEGVIRRADGQRVITPQLTLVPVEEGLRVSMIDSRPRATFRPDGRFVFPAVRPGRYLLMVRAASRPPVPPPRPSSDSPPVVSVVRQLDLWASTEIEVQGRDIEGLSLMLEPGVTISGRVVVEQSAAGEPPDLARGRLQLRPPDAGLPGSTATVNTYMGVPSDDATFSITGVTPGQYLLSLFLSGGTPAGPSWVIKSITVGGSDVFDRPFEVRAGEPLSDVVVTMTDRVTELSGMLQDQLGRPAPDYHVLVFPADASLWTYASARLRPPTRPASDGRYRIVGLPPGDYLVAALGDLEGADYRDAAFLEQVAAAAIRITLAEGEKKALDLRLQGGGGG